MLFLCQVTCPHCQKPNAYANSDGHEGFASTCTSCHRDFQYLRCYNCRKLKYFPKADLIEGSAVSCDFCASTWTQVTCPTCFGSNIFHDNLFQCGKPTKCSSSTCLKVFIQVTCPNQACKASNVWPESHLFREGHPYNCTSCRKAMVCTYCPKCNASNVSLQSQVKEGDVQTCSSCSAAYCKVNCPRKGCHTVIKYPDANYTPLAIIPCHGCSEAFQQACCPSCAASNVWKLSDACEGLLQCAGCKKKWQLVMCTHCKTSNIFKKSEYHEGIPFACQNPQCAKPIQQLRCPHCKRSNVWPNADLKMGKNIVCASVECAREFQHVNCPHCLACNVYPDCSYGESETQICAGCKRRFTLTRCPHCTANLAYKNADYKEGHVEKCGSCNEAFQMVLCRKCRKQTLFHGLDYVPGSTFVCTSCQECAQQFACEFCGFSIVKSDYQYGNRVECPSCKKQTGVNMLGFGLSSPATDFSASEFGSMYTLTALPRKDYGTFELALTAGWSKSDYEFKGISSVSIVNNPHLEAKYESYKSMLEAEHGGEKQFFHGTENKCEGKGCAGSRCGMCGIISTGFLYKFMKTSAGL